ncbi:S10 family peptidase [Shewanella sp.]|uniref:S10 family peptidase n=1 Tax=Shewanella sp. TaxID=50422 RepID=UPI003A968C40
MNRMIKSALLMLALLCAGGVLAEQADISAPIIKQHQGTFAGKTLHYQSVVEPFLLTPLNDNPVKIVSTSYQVGNDAQRPVLFAFNGGPISPSIYLHMLALGPKRLAIPDDLEADPATFALVANQYSPLDVTDIVFYDPANTGFSKMQVADKAGEYYGNVNDAKQFVAFVHAWLQRHQRQSSPVYILGESYGTMRTAAAVQQLSAEDKRINLRGIYLFGQALNLVETAQRPGNVMTYVVSLKTLAALAWYHDKVDKQGRTLPQVLQQVGLFAEGEYLRVLLAGNTASVEEREAVASKLASYTGVSAEEHLAYNLRLSKNQFRLELLKSQQLVLGGSDGRYTAKASKEGQLVDGATVVYPPLYKAFHQYAANELGVDNADSYNVSSPITSLTQWDWGSKAGPFGNWPYADGVTAGFKAFPKLQLYVGVGYYDTQTTTGATEYLLKQEPWPKSQVMLKYYAGGHMAYTVEANLQQFTDDLRSLLTHH